MWPWSPLKLGGALDAHYDHRYRLVAMSPALWHFAAARIVHYWDYLGLANIFVFSIRFSSSMQLRLYGRPRAFLGARSGVTIALLLH